jgi:hypothetical protein
VGEAVEADLARLRRDGLRVLAVDLEVFRPVDLARRQALGELDAQPRLGRVGIDLVLDDAEAVLRHQRVVGLAHLRVVGEAQARLQGVDGRGASRSAVEGVRQHHQRRRLDGRSLAALVGVPGGARGVDGKVVAPRPGRA